MYLPNLLKDNDSNLKSCNQSRHLIIFFYSETAILYLDDESFYYTFIPLFSISISSTTQLKPKTQHMLHNPKNTGTKYLIIRTETCKVILPGWYFRSKQCIFPDDLLIANILSKAATELFCIYQPCCKT